MSLNGADQHFPTPPIPSDCDLRALPFTPIFRARLFGSSFHARATDAEWRAGFTLWLKSWDQFPGGSLPEDDIELCRLAELGRDYRAWKKVKEVALRGWIKCSDGRLYHQVVTESVLEAWGRRATAIAKGKAGASKRWGSANAQAMDQAIAGAMPGDSKGQGQGQGQKVSEAKASGADAPFDPTRDLWDRGVKILGEGGRSLLGKMRKAHGDPVVMQAIIACEGVLPSEAAAYFVKCLSKKPNSGILPNEGVF